MKSYTEAEMERVIDVGKACAELVEVLMATIAKASSTNQANALYLSAIETIVDGVFFRLNGEDEETEKHKFAKETYKALLLSRMKTIIDLTEDDDDGNNTESTDRPLC